MVTMTVPVTRFGLHGRVYAIETPRGWRWTGGITDVVGGGYWSCDYLDSWQDVIEWMQRTWPTAERMAQLGYGDHATRVSGSTWPASLQLSDGASGP